MGQSVISRRRTPVVFIAYGDEGAGWLHALVRRCGENGQVRELMERGVVQFWGIGVAGKVPSGIAARPELPTLPEVAAALDTARSAQARAMFPDLNVRDVLVLERVSLFDPEIAGRRAALHELLASVPDVEGNATQGQQGFRYRWVTLADVIHSPTRVTDESRATAREAALAAGMESLVFLVDRQDSDVAVVNEDLASRCLGELAMTFLHGDIGAPRNDGTPVALPGVLSEVLPGHVVPFGIAVLEHPWHEIQAARVQSFRQRLAAGVPDHRSDDIFGRPSVLLDVVREDRAALDQGRYDPHARRRARKEALESTLGRMFADGDVRYARGILDEVQREVRQLRVATLPLGQPAVLPAIVGIPVVALLAQGTTSPPTVATDDGAASALPLIPIGFAIAVAAVSLLLLWLRRRRPVNPDVQGTRGSIDESAVRGLREEVQREWEQLCRQLSSILEAWDAECRAARAIDGRPVAPGLWQPAPPLAWRLTHPLELSETDVVVSQELCRDVARQCTSLLDDRTPASDVLEEACRRELRKWDERRHVSRTAIAEYLRESLEATRTTVLRRFVESRPYLANPAAPPTRDAIVWLTSPTLGIEDRLKELEQAAARTTTTVLSHDDDERSVRLSLARPVPWHAIPSLAFPSTDV